MVDEGWFDNVLMIDFADYLQNQLVDSEIHSQYDKSFYISRKVIYIIESLRFLFVSFCTFQNQQQMTYDLNSQDFSEFLLALHEGLNNNNIVKNLYTIPQVDTLIATCVKNNVFQELTNEFYFHNVNNIWIGSYLNPVTLEIQHHPLIDVAVGADPDDSKIIATKAFVNDALANFNPTNLQNYYTTQQIDAMLTNYYTSLQVDTIFNNYYTSQYIDANYYTTLATRNMLDTLHNTIISEVNEMFNNNQQPQVWNNQINMSNPLNSITTGLLTMGNIGLSAIVGGGSGTSNNDKGVTQGYVDEEISTNYLAACSYTDTKKQQMEQSFTTQSFTMGPDTVIGFATDTTTPGAQNNRLATSDWVHDAIRTETTASLTNYYTKTEIDAMLQNYQKHGFFTFYILYEDTTGQYKDAQVGCWGNYYQKSATELILNIQVHTPIISDQHSTNIDIWCAFNSNNDFYGAAQTTGTGVFGSCLITSQNNGATCFASLDGNPHNLRFTIYRQNSNNSFSGGLDLKNDRWFLNFNNVHLIKI